MRAYTAGAPLLKGELVKVRARVPRPGEGARRRAVDRRDAPRRTSISPEGLLSDFPASCATPTRTCCLLANMIEHQAIAAYLEALPKTVLAGPCARRRLRSSRTKPSTSRCSWRPRPAPGADRLRHGERVSMGTHDSNRLVIEDGDADTAAHRGLRGPPGATRSRRRPGNRRRRDRRGAGAQRCYRCARHSPPPRPTRRSWRRRSGWRTPRSRAYATACQERGGLTPAFRRTATPLRPQEAEHAAALTAALKGPSAARRPTGTDAKLARAAGACANAEAGGRVRHPAGSLMAGRGLLRTHRRCFDRRACSRRARQIMANEGTAPGGPAPGAREGNAVPNAFENGKASA